MAITLANSVPGGKAGSNAENIFHDYYHEDLWVLSGAGFGITVNNSISIPLIEMKNDWG